MKKLLKVLGIIVLVLFLILLIAPFFLKGKIKTMVKNAANENINAVVDFSDVSLSLLRNFPNATLVIEDLSVTNKAPFEGEKLAELGEFTVTVGLFEVISGDQINVRSIQLNEGQFNVLVLEDGTANYDIAKDTGEETTEEAPAEESGGFQMSLQRYGLDDIDLLYDDKSLGMTMDLNGIDHEGSGDFTQDVFSLKTETEVEEANFIYDGIAYLSGSTANLGVDLKMNLPGMKFTFERGDIQVNRLALQATGWLAMPEEDIDMDIQFSAPENDLRSVISLIPAEFAKQMEGVNTTGDFTLAGYVKGTYNEQSMPGFGIDLDVKNGTFQYPDLPRKAEKITIDLKVDAPGGSDIMKGMKVDLNRFFLALGSSGGHSNTAEAAMKLRNLGTDPSIDATAKADMDLGSFSDLVPLEEGQSIAGIFTCDVLFKGNMSAVEKQQFNDFTAEGTASLKDFAYKSPDYNAQLTSTTMSFSPQKLDLKELKGNFEETNFEASGSVNNYLAYALEDSVLSGEFNFTADKIDLNKFMGDTEESEEAGEEEEEAEADTSSTSTLAVPKNIDFTMSTRIGELIYDNLSMSDVAGTVVIRNGIADMKNLALNTLGGKVILTGQYNTEDPANPKFSFAYDVRSVDIKQTASTFNTIEKLAPIAKKMKGNVSSNFNLNARMDGQMNPIMDSFVGGGSLTTESLSLEDVKSLDKLASAVGMNRISDQQVKDTKVSFTFADGKVSTEPFDVKLGNVNTNVSGYVTFEQKMNYDLKMKVPRAAFGDAINSAASGFLDQLNDRLGSDLSVGETINVTVKVTGPVDDPKFAPKIAGMGDPGQSVKEQVEEKVKEEIDKKKEEITAEMRERADKILADAEKQAQKVRDEARKLADRIRSEADDKAQKLVDDASNPIAKAGAKAAAKKIREEADKKANNIVEEADKKADRIMEEAQKRADQILNSAEGK